jgi:prophage regulatory protein
MKLIPPHAEYMTAKEVAECFRVSPSTIWRWTRDNIIPAPINVTPKSTRWLVQDIRDAQERFRTNRRS